MYIRVIRTALLCTFVLPTLLSCAGDDDAANTQEPCMDGMMSLMLVGGPGDPCIQNQADNYGKIVCPATDYMAVSMCTGGKWKYPCDCIPKPPVCGNGHKEKTEQCEGADIGTANCAGMVGAGYTGVVTCSAQCTLVTSGCMPPRTMPPVGGAGG